INQRKRSEGISTLTFERFLIWLENQFSSDKKLQDLLKFFRDENTRNIENIQFVQYSTQLSLESRVV
ncbi:unnamed protein product, partial [marine sediment metagenome]